MTIAHDATTLSGPADGPYSFTHTPVGVPKGVIITVVQADVPSSQTHRCTYGGKSLSKIVEGPSVLGGEDSYVTIYFLGTDIPTGPQTVTISTGPFGKAVVCHTVTATGDTEVDTSNHESFVSLANPSLSLTTSAPAEIYYCFNSGTTTPVSTVQAGSTHVWGIQHGSSDSAMFARKTVVGAGATTIGYTHAADDVNHAAIAIKDWTLPVGIEHDKFTGSPLFPATTGTHTFVHTPIGTPKGVVAVLGHEDIGGVVDRVSNVTYGGVSMTRIVRAIPVGEQNSVYIYFLGAGIPLGPQTFSVDFVSTLGSRLAVVVNTILTMNGSDTLVDVFNSASPGSLPNPSLSLTPTAEAVIYYGLGSGLAAPFSTDVYGALETYHQIYYENDGASSQHYAQKYVRTAGATTIDIRTGSDDVDDVNHAAVAIKQGAAPPDPFPDTFIDSADIDDTTNTATFTFSSSIPGSTFECSMDGAAFTPCTTPSVYSGLSDGAHIFAVRASFGGNTDPTPATFEFTLNPAMAQPTRPSRRGRLGCSVNKAHITWRCGFPRLCSLVGITDLNYTRVLDDISEATITISLAGTDDICCECLGDIEPWCHELHITREAEETWVGPITEIQYGYDTVIIRAQDILGWLNVRIAEIDMPTPDNTTYDLTDIALQILDVAFADDSDGPCALDYIVAEPTGILLEQPNVPPASWMFPRFTDTAFEQLDQLSGLGLDFTVIGRSIVLGPEDFPVAPIATLTDDHIIGDVRLTKNGTLQGNRWYVHFTGDDGDPAVREAAVQCYGRIEKLRSEDTALQTLADAEQVAQAYVDAASTTPRLIEVPLGSQLSPETPWQLSEMIPGARVDVSLTKLCVDATQSFRLVGVEVNQDADGEKISVNLSPVNVLTGDI